MYGKLTGRFAFITGIWLVTAEFLKWLHQEQYAEVIVFSYYAAGFFFSCGILSLVIRDAIEDNTVASEIKVFHIFSF